MLTFEAIMLWLAVPVMIKVLAVPTSYAFVVGGGLGMACIVAVGLLGQPLGYQLGHGIQALFVGVGLYWLEFLLVSILFAGLWVGAYVIGMRVDHARAIR